MVRKLQNQIASTKLQRYYFRHFQERFYARLEKDYLIVISYVLELNEDIENF